MVNFVCLKRVIPFTLLAVAVTTARANVLYDNLFAATTGTDAVQGFGPLYDSFSVGGTAVTLNYVSLSLVNPNASTGQFGVGLYSDNNSTPGAIFASGVASDSIVGTSTTIVTFSGALSLNANTRYWVGVSAEPAVGSGIGWNWSLDTSGTGVANEYFSNSSGTYPYTDGPYQMQIGATAAPEPATMALIGVGALGLLKRRKK